MPKKMVLVNYDKCQPEQCDSGTCKAVLACPHKLLQQEKPYEPPMPHPSLCRNCVRCVLACQAKAIELA